VSVYIRYRFLKEKGDYLNNLDMTRGYTMVEADTIHLFHQVLKEFYKDFKGKGVQIFNIWRTPAGEANYRIEEEERKYNE